jgi:hopanoid biosynthesis associated protein HpnK
MVGAPAADDAIARARRMPDLKVGLHVVLVQGEPVLPPSEVPALLGRDGRFPDNLARAGLKWFFSPAARRQLRREVAAQFAAFRETGLALDHVNAHNHMHLHPTVLSAILAELNPAGLNASHPAAVRLPREPWSASLRGVSSVRIRAVLERGVMAPWLKVMEHRLKRRGIPHNQWLFGLTETGRMNEATLLQVIDTLPEGVVEIYCHPATRRPGAITNSMSGYDNEGEFHALVSGRVRTRLVERKLRVGGFADICKPA